MLSMNETKSTNLFDSLDQPDAVLIDDDSLVHTSWQLVAKYEKISLLSLSSAKEFFTQAFRIDKLTPIYIDSDLGPGLSGEWIAKDIYALGFKDIHLQTGREPEQFRAMPWLKTVAGKDPPKFARIQTKQNVINADPVIVVGAGIAGLMFAILQARRGEKVILIERRPDFVEGTYSSARSVNFTLSSRGLAMLKEAALQDEVLKYATPLHYRALHLDTRIINQPYGQTSTEILYAIRRFDLVRILYSAAKTNPNIEFNFNSEFDDIVTDRKIVTFRNMGTLISKKYSIFVAADGALSTSVRKLQSQQWCTYHFDVSDWGYKEFTIPAIGGRNTLTTNALHLWSKGHSLVCAIPNPDGTFVGNIIMPMKGKISFETFKESSALEVFLRQNYADILPICLDMTKQLIDAPSASIVTTKLENWVLGGDTIVIGDACHGISPFLGQGMNAALEDAVILNRILRNDYIPIKERLVQFQAFRKPDTDALITLSQEHLDQLRLHLGSPWQISKHRAKQALAKLFPRYFRPKYSLIAHGVVPYRTALASAKSITSRFSELAIFPLQLIFFIGAFFPELKGQQDSTTAPIEVPYS